MLILGVTGGIATGKSVVTRMLAGLGAPTVSADALAHALLAPDAPTTRAVLAAFPDAAALLSSAVIDRAALGRLVFADPAARRRLEAITHPAIIAALQSQFDAWRPLSAPRAGIGEIPLLFEAGLERLTDKIVVAACTEKMQIARLKARDGLDEGEAKQRLAAQWPLAEKIARADVVINTDGGLDETRRQVADLWESLQV